MIRPERPLRSSALVIGVARAPHPFTANGWGLSFVAAKERNGWRYGESRRFAAIFYRLSFGPAELS